MDQLLEYNLTVFNHKVESGFWEAVRWPHNTSKLTTIVQKVSCVLIEEILEKSTVEYGIQSHPVFLTLGPQKQVLKHLFKLPY